MADLLVFDPEDNLLSILSNSADEACQFWDAPYKEIVNNGSFFEFTAQGDHEDSKHLIAENQVAFLDKDGVFRLFVIKEPNQTNDLNGPIIHCLCESAMNELNEEIIEDIRPYNSTLRNALTRALSETRWEVGETADLGINSTNFYYINVSEAIESIINIWGGEIRDRIEVQDNKIIGRYIDILPRRGQDTGKLWEIDKDILYLSHKVQSYPKTALYGRGSSLEIEDEEGNATGGFTRKISFADVEWKISKGDPVDKPKGQTWVGDLQALAQFGKLNKDGSRRHRKGIYENGEQEDPEALLQETWEALQQEKKQLHNYEMDVFLLEEITGHEHEKVRLGDTTYAIDRSFTNPVEVEERIIAFEYDVAAPDNSGYVELGQYIDLYSDEDRIDQIESKLNDKSGIWDKGGGPITDDRFPKITPSKPINFVADGNFQTITLTWDYDAASYLSSYELYASQVQGFTPDQSNLIWRGKMSGHNFIAETNQQWYFRVRAVNTHGVAGPFTDEIMAQTVRIISDDILFGPDIAAELRELSKTADILADGTIYADMIRQDVYDQIQADSKQYTDAEITATEVSLMSELANKAGFDYVDGKIYLVNEELINKVDNGVYQNKILQIDNSLHGLSLRAQNVEANVNELNGEVSNALSQITAVDIKANGISTSVNELRSDFNNLEIGGRNLYYNSLFDRPVGIWGSVTLTKVDGNPNSMIAKRSTTSSQNFGFTNHPDDRNINFKQGQVYTLSFEVRGTVTTLDYIFRMRPTESNAVLPPQAVNSSTEFQKVSITFTSTWSSDSGYILIGSTQPEIGKWFEIRRVMLVEGEKEVGWNPAPEDINSRISSAETKIDQTAYELTFKATTQEVNSLTGRMTSAESSIRLLSDDIELKVDRDGIISAINVQPGTVKIHTRLLDVGDFTNLIDNGDFEDDTVGQLPSGWINENYNTTIQVVDQTSWSGNNGSSKCLGLWASDVRNVDAQQERIIKVQEGDELYFELDYRFNNLVGPGSLSYGVRTYDLKKQHLSWTTVAYATTKTYAWTKLTGTYKVPAGVGYIRLRVSFTNNGEITNRAWIDNLVVRRKNNAALIVDGSITASLMAANSITAQNGALANASITRAKLQDAIIGTAQIDDLAVTAAKISSINADKINSGAIRGIDIYGAQFRSSDGLTQLDITGGNVRLRQNNGRYVLISPDGLFGYNSGGDVRFQADRTLVTSSAFGTSNTNVYLAAMEGGEARVVDYRDVPSDGSIDSYRYLPLRASGIYANFVNVNGGLNGIHLYLRPFSEGEVRITRNGTTDSYRSVRASGYFGDYFETNTITAGTNLFIRPASGAEVRFTDARTTGNYSPIRGSRAYFAGIATNTFAGGTHLYLGANGDVRATGVTFGDNDIIWRDFRGAGLHANFVQINDQTDATHLYLRMGSTGEARVTRSNTTGTYQPIRASEFRPPSSKRDTKKNIEKLERNVLDEIRKLSIYKFNYKFEEEEHKRHIGVMLDEVTSDVVASTGDTVDFYSMIGYSLKGIKDVISITDLHADEINWLKIENQYLKQTVVNQEKRIAHLEGLLNVA
ncbi:phage tail spike protein [Cytobacillus sp. FSL W7-1323]|uniref:phage tail spike protein n=1 Tax=Cytobacillus sp. FSL W7-1323 TaxID=2921700 RepID=UPI003158C0DD